jgi:hypothetical protein
LKPSPIIGTLCRCGEQGKARKYRILTAERKTLYLAYARVAQTFDADSTKGAD